MTLLGKHTFWSKLEYYFIFPFWFASDNPKKKSKNELYYGLIPHVHQYDYEHPFVECGVTLAKCKHYGCYLCDPFESLRKMKIESDILTAKIEALKSNR